MSTVTAPAAVRKIFPDAAAYDDRPAPERRDIEQAARRDIEFHARQAEHAHAGDEPDFHQLAVGCRCPRCECLVPGEFVIRNLLDTPPFAATRCRTTAYCEHCGILFHLDAELKGGFWSDLAPASVDPDAARKRAHFNRVKRRMEHFERAIVAQAC